MKKGELRKDELIAINEKLQSDNDRLLHKDQGVRKNLTSLLTETFHEDYRFRDGIVSEQRDRVMSWMDITFHIGRLKTDSAFSEMKRRVGNDKQHIEHLNKCIKELEEKLEKKS